MQTLTSSQWTSFLKKYPQAHLLQTAAWGDFKSSFGWQPIRIQSGNCGAQILFRQLPLGLTIAYIPKGPLGLLDADIREWDSFWLDLDLICRQRRAIFLKVEPDAWEPEDFTKALPQDYHFAKPIQPRRTALVDLSGSQEEWLGRMKQKTRYNIHLAERKDVEVTFSNDVSAFHQIMRVTGERDGFGIHSLSYYQKAYQVFAEQGKVGLLTAKYQDTPLAALMVFTQGNTAWYFYGASTNEERNRMPTYLLQWRAMQWAAEQGCRFYDLWGIPDADEDELEAHFSDREDGLWGVYRFKRGFGGRIIRSVGAWDKVFNPLMYRLYQVYLQRRGSED